ncbi:ABC transporter ATP-binding protein [Candidatus Saccharibacteria bacterium]|nr:ABC transporter ATP-binding protein [Candidatus Saccharibacteria bacterium]
MGNIIEVRDLKKKYGKHEAVKGVTFSVARGEVFGILGPNGAGKTTTLEMMETLLSITSGTVEIDGVDVAKDPRAVQKMIGVQLQSTAFLEKLTLKDQLELFAGVNGVKVNVEKLLKDFDLVAKKDEFPENLSGGQRQRFSIATAIVHEPKVIFLDEPTTGLDPQARRNLWELVQTIKKQGITVILTTHYMDEAELLCDRVAMMDGGKILTINTPKKLIKELLGRGFKKAQVVEQANLEDVFIDLTGKDLRE